MFSGRLLLPIITWTLSATQLSADMAVAIIGGRMTLQEFGDRFVWLVLLSLVTNLVVDFLNAGGLCYFLLKERSDNLVKRLVNTILIME